MEHVAVDPARNSHALRGRLNDALAADPPPGTAVVLLNRDSEIELSSPDADRWLVEHLGAGEHPGWLPGPVVDRLALPPRPPVVRERDARQLSVSLLPGDPHAFLFEERVARFRADARDRLGLTPRETEVLRAAAIVDDEADIPCDLFLSLHAVRARLDTPEAKLGVRTASAAVARALRESTSSTARCLTAPRARVRLDDRRGVRPERSTRRKPAES